MVQQVGRVEGNASEMIDLILLALLSLTVFAYVYKDDEVFVGIGSNGLSGVPLDKHITILGPTRSGKTTLARKIAKRSRKKVLVLDWNGEYEIGLKVPASRIKVDISNINKKILVELIGLSLNLNEPSIYFMYRSLKDQKIERLEDLIRGIDAYLTTTRSETEMKAAILRRLEYIADALSEGDIPLEVLIGSKRDLTIDLSNLSLVEEKILVSSMILTYIYNLFRKKEITKDIKLLMIIDEAQNLLNLSVIKHIITEMAKYGIRCVLVTNVLPPNDILSHTNIIIVKPHISFNLEVKYKSIIINDKIIKIYKFL